ncbi:MAG TPA: metalloregulator ArsR/SmtB family transcription factor [Terriglobales bacterium]|nr:metalloregulator ArsR/SmtB family transcription factor [Terriglobales bacterium]
MKLEQYCRGLADITRLRMLNLLLHGELCGCDIQYVLQMPQPNVSRHLTYLKNCGLVSDRRDGPRIFYRLAESRSGTTKHLFEFLQQAFKGEELFQEDTLKLKESIQAGSCTRSQWRPFAALVSTRSETRT